MRASYRAEHENVTERDAPPPLITLPRVKWLETTQAAEAQDIKETAERFMEHRTIKSGRNALEAIEKAETFAAWLAIGKALAVGKAFALRTTGANAAWGRNYSHAFGEWMKEHGFASLPKSTRSHAIELAEHEAAITAWRDSLPDRQRRRLVHPLSVTRRWRAATASPEARSPADLRRDATAAWKRFCACAEALPPDQSADLWAIVKARRSAAA